MREAAASQWAQWAQWAPDSPEKSGDIWMLHGADICTPTFARTKSPSHVGKIYQHHGASGYILIILAMAQRF